MQEAIKLVPIVILLTACASLPNQERTEGIEARASSKKIVTIDPTMQEEMMTIASNSGQATPAPEGVATGAQVQALVKSINELRQEIVELRRQVENSPRYLDQSEHPLWP